MVRLASILMLFLAALPATAHATQAHGGPEGLHAHQMAHVFFAFSMGLLIYWLAKWHLIVSRGWRLIQYSALLFIFWNAGAFATHWLEEQSALIQINRVAIMQIQITTAPGYEWLAWIYYLAKLDHLVCVPALLLLLMGLRRLLKAPARSIDLEDAGP